MRRAHETRRELGGRCAWALALVLGCGLAAGARASEGDPEARPLTMLLWRTPGDGEVIGRLRAELPDDRWSFIERSGDGGELALAELARARRAAAAARVDVSALEIELWFAALPPHRNESREVIEARDEALLSLRAAEALRARGLPVGSSAAGARPVPEQKPLGRASGEAPAARDGAPQAEADTAATLVPHVRLSLAPALSASPGGLGPGLGAQLALQIALTRALSLGALALVPLWSESLQRDEGTARMLPLLLGLGLDARLSLGGFELGAGAGGGVAVAYMRAGAERPLRAQRESASAAALFARAALAWPRRSALRVHATALAGATLVPIRMRFVDREVGRWGQPFVAVGVGVQLGLEL